jgi:hypothetical protein
MDPEQERTGRAPIEPAQGPCHHLLGPALHRGVPVLPAALGAESAVVGLEAAVEARGQPGAGIEDERADEGGGVVPAGGEPLREPGHGSREGNAEVVHAMGLRIGAAQDRRVRDRGDRRLGIGLLEDGALAGQRIELRGQATRRAQEPHAIGARGVEGDEDDVRTVGSGGGDG